MTLMKNYEVFIDNYTIEMKYDQAQGGWAGQKSD